jgi:hypothetical protein
MVACSGVTELYTYLRAGSGFGNQNHQRLFISSSSPFIDDESHATAMRSTEAAPGNRCGEFRIWLLERWVVAGPLKRIAPLIAIPSYHFSEAGAADCDLGKVTNHGDELCADT